MKFPRIILTLVLICFGAVGFADSQTKSKAKNSDQKLVEVKANVMVLNTANQFVEDIKAEDIKIYENGVEQKISNFVKRPEILNLGIAVDNSGSMKFMLKEIVALGKSIVSNLNDNDEAFIIRFVDSDKIEVQQEWTSNKAELKTALEDLYIEGGQTAIIDAIFLSGEKLAERAKKNSSKKYALIVISDGEDRDSFYKYKEMMAVFKNTNIQVFMLAYSSFNSDAKTSATDTFANQIALETGGTVINLPKKRTNDDILAALKNIISELRSQYIISYSPINQKYDGNSRTLRVEIADGENGEKRTAYIRQNYTPVKYKPVKLKIKN